MCDFLIDCATLPAGSDLSPKKATSDGVPASVYIVFIVMDFVGCALAFLLRPPEKVVREDGTNIAVVKARPFLQELKGNIEAFKDWRLLIMVCHFFSFSHSLFSVFRIYI